VVVAVVADADTLFGGTTRGLLIHLDYQGLIRLHWSPLILDETGCRRFKGAVPGQSTTTISSCRSFLGLYSESACKLPPA